VTLHTSLDPDDTRIPAIGYIRVSMAREEMISPELQKSAIAEWAKRTNHRIDDWIEDLDKTGRNFKRRIMEAIERVERQEVRVIAVWKYSRFGRSRTGVPVNLARVEKAGGALLSATEEVDAKTATGRFQRGMIMELNAFESDRAGEQWKETHQWRRDSGLPASGRPRFGYVWYPRKVYSPDGTITIQDERYEINHDVAPVIAEAYQRYINGEGFKQIAKTLNDMGVPSARGMLWAADTVRRYMDSGFAAGYLRIHDPACEKPYRSECPNHLLVKHPQKHHPEIISEEVWVAYQERRGLIRTTAPRSRRAAHPLSGLVRCGRCTFAARRKVAYGGYAYFVCNERKTKGQLACDGTAVSQNDAEAQVVSWLAKLSRELDSAADGKAVRIRGEEIKRADLEAARLQEQIDRIGRAINRHMKAYAMADDDGDDLNAEYLATLSELRAERSAAAEALERVKRVQSDDDSAVVRLRLAAPRLAADLMTEWDTLPSWQLNALLRRLVARVVVMADKSVEVVPTWEAQP